MWGMNASSLRKYSASERMTPPTSGLYQVAARPKTDSRRRKSSVTTGCAKVQGRPAGVWPMPVPPAPSPLQTGTRLPRSSISVFFEVSSRKLGLVISGVGCSG